MKIMFLDICSNKNAGDAAMQFSLIDIIKENIPNGKVLLATRFGQNQKVDALQEFEEFRKLDETEIIPGAYQTFVSFESQEKSHLTFLRKVKKLLASFKIFPLLISISFNLKTLALILSKFQGGTYTQKATDADVILWNGRNVRRVNGIRGYLKLAELLANPAMVSYIDKPKYICGMSFWPIKRGLNLWILKGVISKFDKLYVRETESLKIARKIGLRNVVLMPDLSFYFLKGFPKSKSIKKTNSLRKKQIAVTLVSARELTNVIKMENYINLIVNTLNVVKEKYELKPIIVRQVTYGPEVEDEVINIIKKKVKDLDVLPPPTHIKDLLHVYSESSLLLATRMHSAIFSMSCGTPVVAMPYDWKGKWQILTDLGQPSECLLPLIKIQEKEVLEGINYAIKNTNEWNKIAANINKESCNLNNIFKTEIFAKDT